MVRTSERGLHALCHVTTEYLNVARVRFVSSTSHTFFPFQYIPLKFFHSNENLTFHVVYLRFTETIITSRMSLETLARYKNTTLETAPDRCCRAFFTSQHIIIGKTKPRLFLCLARKITRKFSYFYFYRLFISSLVSSIFTVTHESILSESKLIFIVNLESRYLSDDFFLDAV